MKIDYCFKMPRKDSTTQQLGKGYVV